jgi:cytochrome c-type biogenesis protein
VPSLIEVFTAATAGLLSFLSPCVFPLVPSYLAMLAGSSVAELRTVTGGAAATVGQSTGAADIRRRAFLRSLFFTLGFTVVFVLLGLVFSQANAMIGGQSRIWSVIAGLVVIVLGVNVAFDLLAFLNIEKRFHAARRPGGLVSSFLFGAAFGAGWSPCVGPILASILLMAGTGSLAKAAILLAFYSAGLALPFLLAGTFFGRLEGVLKALKKRMGLVKAISGLLLVVIGLYMALGDFRTLSGDLVRAGYALQEATDQHPLVLRLVVSLLYGLLTVVLVSFSRRRTSQSDGESKKKSFNIGLAAGVLSALLAVAEGVGLLNTARLMASWLLYQGI